MLNTDPVVVRRTMAGLREQGYVHSVKGHGGGWTLSRPLEQISLLDIHRALGSPEVFAIGLAIDHPNCLVEQSVNAALQDAFAEAEAILVSAFSKRARSPTSPATSTTGYRGAIHGRGPAACGCRLSRLGRNLSSRSHRRVRSASPSCDWRSALPRSAIRSWPAKSPASWPRSWSGKDPCGLDFRLRHNGDQARL